jgi:hypothetical protein
MSTASIVLSGLVLVCLLSFLWTRFEERDAAATKKPTPWRPRIPSGDAFRYRAEWTAVRARFRRFPGLAVAQADDLVRRILESPEYSPPASEARRDMMALGAELEAAEKRDLALVFDYYASILDGALLGAVSNEIRLDQEAPEQIDLRTGRILRGSGRHMGWSR